MSSSTKEERDALESYHICLLVCLRIGTDLKPPLAPALSAPTEVDLIGRDSILLMSRPRKAKTEQALNSWPGPSFREKTTEVLHNLLSDGDCNKESKSDCFACSQPHCITSANHKEISQASLPVYKQWKTQILKVLL